jgi:hypothetical protein
MEWPEIKLTIERHPHGALVTDAKVLDVSKDQCCYLLRGWNLENPEHVVELTRFVDACISTGFHWALQQGHPDNLGRGEQGQTRRYISFGRSYCPQPAWDVAANNPGGLWYVIEERHADCLIANGIPFDIERGGGRNPRVKRALLQRVLEAIQEQVEAGDTRESRADRAQQQIELDIILRPTEKEELIRARRGQGIFRRRVMNMEPYCRLTGVSDARFLRASHIRPWADSDNQQRLDGNNGLMLSPHVDHLFDGGYISFEQNGRVLVASDINSVLEDWALPIEAIGSPFSDEQEHYLAYHRVHCFRGQIKR